MSESLRFYFSFRSPFACFAAERREGEFGFPTFVYGNELFFGQGRMEFVREAVLRARPTA